MLKYTQKLKNQVFRNFITPYLSDSMTERVKTCGGFLEMLADATLKKETAQGQFLRQPLLPHVRMAASAQRRAEDRHDHEMALDRLRKAVYFCDTNHAQRIGGGTAGRD